MEDGEEFNAMHGRFNSFQFAHEQCEMANNAVQQNETANTTWQMCAAVDGHGFVAWRTKKQICSINCCTNGFGLQVVTNKWTRIFPAQVEAKCLARQQVRFSAFDAVVVQPPLCQWCLSCLHSVKFVRKRKIPFDWVFKRTQLPINVATNKWKCFCWLTHWGIPGLICEKKRLKSGHSIVTNSMKTKINGTLQPIVHALRGSSIDSSMPHSTVRKP